MVMMNVAAAPVCHAATSISHAATPFCHTSAPVSNTSTSVCHACTPGINTWAPLCSVSSHLSHHFLFHFWLQTPHIRLQRTRITGLDTTCHEPAWSSWLNVRPLFCAFKAGIPLHFEILDHRLVADLECLRVDDSVEVLEHLAFSHEPQPLLELEP